MCVLYLADALTHQVYLLPITSQDEHSLKDVCFSFWCSQYVKHPVCDAQSWLISIFKACWQLNTSVSQILSVENIYLDFIYLVWLARNEELLAILSQYWYLGLFVTVKCFLAVCIFGFLSNRNYNMDTGCQERSKNILWSDGIRAAVGDKHQKLKGLRLK